MSRIDKLLTQESLDLLYKIFIGEAFSELVKSTVIKGKRVPVRNVTKRIKRRAVKRYAKYQAREQSKK